MGDILKMVSVMLTLFSSFTCQKHIRHALPNNLGSRNLQYHIYLHTRNTLISKQMVFEHGCILCISEKRHGKKADEMRKNFEEDDITLNTTVIRE